MSITLSIGIQGLGSTSIGDIGIIADLLGKTTDITLKIVPEDDALLRMQWLKQGQLDLV